MREITREVAGYVLHQSGGLAGVAAMDNNMDQMRGTAWNVDWTLANRRILQSRPL